MSKKNTALQAIRLSTIRHQLKALASQIDAIQKLDAEHHEGIDLGKDPELTNILFFSKRLAKRADTITKSASRKDKDGVTSLLESMREDVTYLSEHAGTFHKHAKFRAADHLREMIHIEAEDVTSEAESVKAESNFVHAGLSCFRAEVNQYRTFELQVLAIVHLALEIAYFAADEVGVPPLAVTAQ